VPGRLEEAVAGLEQLNRLAFQLKIKAPPVTTPTVEIG
jgi:hypothetical protein